MLRRTSLVLSAAVALAACGPHATTAPASGVTAAPSAQTPGAPSTESSALDKLFKDSWEAGLADDPIEASTLGDRRWNDKWPEYSLASVERRRVRREEELRRLHAIPRAALDARQQVNYDLFERGTQQRLEGAPYFYDGRVPGSFALVPLNQREGLQSAGETSEQLRFETIKDYEDWIARMHAFPAFAEQHVVLMREGIKRRFVHSRIVMERVPAQLDRQIGPAEKSSFFKPFTQFPASIPAPERDRLTRAAKEAIERDVVPAYKRFKEFFTKEYLPACFDQVGAWQEPDGAAFYAFSARVHTTTRMTPKEIHETGMREVTRIRGEMMTVMAQVGFKGTLKEFFAMLRTDPRFYFKSGEELLEAYRALAKRIDPKLVRMFKTLPRTPYGVEPIPATVAPDTTTAYYQPPADDGSRAGAYYVNLYKPEARPKWEMMALSLHESVPGHHLQIALAQEHGALPDFRRHSGYSAFVEGWGLYAESLGAEMGLYDDPYSKFGQLTYEMWRAVRLVVDTGIHEMKWTRKQAIDFFMENAAKQELDVTNEVDRYIAWPGQALAYKIGELAIKDLRARAMAKLGTRFDVREFHDAVLEEGALPLDVLATHIDAWIAARQARAN